MSLRPRSALRTHDPELERYQREHELDEVLTAGRAFQARLEMLGGHDGAVASIRRLRDDLAAHLMAIDDTPNFVDAPRPDEGGALTIGSGHSELSDPRG